jgi:hypothetical protein
VITEAQTLRAPKAPRRRSVALAASIAALSAIALAGCAETTSASKFKGESHAVAEVISSFASHAGTADGETICDQELSKALKTKLSSAGTSCKSTIEEQLHEVDTFNLTIESISIEGKRASAKVSSTVSGKPKLSTLSLVKEGKSWRISGSGA